jgi:hypothetical protein
LLNTLLPNNVASVTDTTSLTSTYSNYEILFENVLPVTNQVAAFIQVHSGGAFKAIGYLNSGSWNDTGGGFFAGLEGSVTSALQISGSSATNTSGGVGFSVPGIGGTVRFINPSSGSASMTITNVGYMNSQNTAVNVFATGFWNSSGVIDGFAFKFFTGNVSTGTIKVYGIS